MEERAMSVCGHEVIDRPDRTVVIFEHLKSEEMCMPVVSETVVTYCGPAIGFESKRSK